MCQLECPHLIISETGEWRSVSTLTFSIMALCSAVSLLHFWAEEWDRLHHNNDWETQKGSGVVQGEDRKVGVCVCVCVVVCLCGGCCLLTWSSIRQPPHY